MLNTERLQQFNQLTLDLHQNVTKQRMQDFKTWIFARLEEFIPFHMGIWAFGEEQELTIHHVHSHHLPPEFMHNWEQYKTQDLLLKRLLREPGECFSIEDAYQDIDRSKLEIVKKHSQAYGLEHSMSIALKEPVTGLFNVVSLYRNWQLANFTFEEKQFMKLLMPHLVEVARFNRFLFIHHLQKEKSFPSGIAICDQVGLLHVVDDDFPALLGLEWPHWQGAWLPKTIQTILNNKLAMEYRGEKIHITINALDDLLLLHVRTLNSIDRLTEREKTVAQLLACGKSYKGIAQQLEIAHSTVNKHTLSVYTKLGVKNKTELARIFEINS